MAAAGSAARDRRTTRARTAESAADAVAAGIRGRLAEAGERLEWLGLQPFVGRPRDRRRRRCRDAARWHRCQPARRAALSSRSPSASGPRHRYVRGARSDGVRRRSQRAPPTVSNAGRPSRATRSGRARCCGSGACSARRRTSPARWSRISGSLQLGAVRTDDLPAELAALNGQRSTYIAMADREQANDVGRRLLQGLDSGRWPIDARARRTLSRAVHGAATRNRGGSPVRSSDVWRDTDGRLSARGQRVFAEARTRRACSCCGDRTARTPRRSRRRADRFFDVPAATAAAWQLIDPEGHVIAGDAAARRDRVARIIGNSEYPWTLHTWTDSPTRQARAAAARSCSR